MTRDMESETMLADRQTFVGDTEDRVQIEQQSLAS
jgi:hypothetical protein